jgi:hypothetical protein
MTILHLPHALLSMILVVTQIASRFQKAFILFYHVSKPPTLACFVLDA